MDDCCEAKTDELIALHARHGRVLATVLAAAWAVAWTGSAWPDIAVGLGIALLFLRTAFGVLRESRQELERASSGEMARASSPDM